MRRAVAAVLAAGLLAACAPQRGVDNQEMAQANLYADVNAMKSRMQETRVRLDGLEQRLGGRDGESSLADLDQRLTRLEEAVNRLASALSMDTGIRPRSGSGQPGQSAVVNVPATSGTEAYGVDTPGSYAASPPGRYAQGDSPASAVYAMGMEAFNARDYDRAISLFSELVKGYPGDPQVPNALYWQAEANFQQGDAARCALLCQDLIQKYPNSSVAPSAMLKQAVCFKRLGRGQAAKIMFQDVIKRYPNTPEARSAQIQMRDLR